VRAVVAAARRGNRQGQGIALLGKWLEPRGEARGQRDRQGQGGGSHQWACSRERGIAGGRATTYGWAFRGGCSEMGWEVSPLLAPPR
jgi:hypothetical protein